MREFLQMPRVSPAAFQQESHAGADVEQRLGSTTLMPRLLGCTNPPSDYSSGRDLFESRGWPWLLAGSYYNYAVLEPGQITVTFPNGLFEVRDWDYRLVAKPEFSSATLEAVMRENKRFYH
mgnify:CR=1 FL=1